MQEIDLNIILLTAVVSFAVALAALWLLSHFMSGTKKTARALMAEAETATVFLFDDEVLIDATPNARMLLGPQSNGKSDWERMVTAFLPQFSSLASDLGVLAQAGTLTLLSDDPDDPARIEAEWWDGLTRLVLHGSANANAVPLIDRPSLTALETELDILRQTAKSAPYLVWQETGGGQISWANAAYLALVNQINPDSNSWSPANLFKAPTLASGATNAKTRRTSLAIPGKPDLLWFDISGKQVNDSTLFFATETSAIVRAESSRDEFVQTLAKTFAHLSVGLAVFDKKRQLVLFNPALTDLVRLPIDFLSSRPTLFTFLDRLREHQMMPEPKDYKSWRQQMSALEEAATDGTYEETWTLPNGQTYRVNGRPHPDGAVAILFEDISAEISLTRHFRSELETGQAVIDSLDEAIVVFSSSGQVVMSNTAYADLWGVDPGSAFGEISAIEATRNWQENCKPTPVWGDFRDFVAQNKERTEWFGDATHKDGHSLTCRFVPLAAGETLVSFSRSNIPANPALPLAAKPKKALSG